MDGAVISPAMVIAATGRRVIERPGPRTGIWAPTDKARLEILAHKSMLLLGFGHDCENISLNIFIFF